MRLTPKDNCLIATYAFAMVSNIIDLIEAGKLSADSPLIDKTREGTIDNMALLYAPEYKSEIGACVDKVFDTCLM